jgi:protein-S-isoprenylcysteine O-methyltransferase Ste14
MVTLHRARLLVTFAWLGGALFVASLAVLLYSYVISFGRPGFEGRRSLAVACNVLLFSTFALHHSAFARTGAKSFVARHVPPALERSVYVWIASLLLIAVCVFWQPVAGELYRIDWPLALIGYAIQIFGITITARGSSAIDALDLAGIRQTADGVHGRVSRRVPLQTTGVYGFVRHPLYFAWLLFVFATPHMTFTRLEFAVLSSAYLALAIPLEERALINAFGESYLTYQRKVRWRMLPGVY